jgi:beta-1,4-N-acetylglucosaminyltransferase
MAQVSEDAVAAFQVQLNSPVGTCLPLVWLAYMFRAIGLGRTRITFVESVCRVKTLSLTGRLVYPLVDRFFVQWPELHER